MYEVLKSKLKDHKTAIQKYNYLREYLQLLILKIIDEKGYFRNIAFVGGTALRILYDLNRFSEDLDFCLSKRDSFKFIEMMHVLEKELQQLNFQVETNVKEHKTVAGALIKFNKLLSPLGMSPLPEQKLTIKMEIDTNPPSGFNTEFSLINKEFLMNINHYDLPSLFAGKLHALLCRKYTKGRDFYDLIWYLGRKVEPNYVLLGNAIEQTEGKILDLNKDELRKLLIERINATDFNKVRQDVEPFLADSKELRFFDKDYFLQMLK